MNYYKLIGTEPEILEKIKEAEKKGEYSSHLDPIDYNKALKRINEIIEQYI